MFFWHFQHPFGYALGARLLHELCATRRFSWRFQQAAGGTHVSYGAQQGFVVFSEECDRTPKLSGTPSAPCAMQAASGELVAGCGRTPHPAPFLKVCAYQKYAPIRWMYETMDCGKS